MGEHTGAFFFGRLLLGKFGESNRFAREFAFLAVDASHFAVVVAERCHDSLLFLLAEGARGLVSSLRLASGTEQEITHSLTNRV